MNMYISRSCFRSRWREKLIYLFERELIAKNLVCKIIHPFEKEMLPEDIRNNVISFNYYSNDLKNNYNYDNPCKDVDLKAKTEDSVIVEIENENITFKLTDVAYITPYIEF